MRTHAIIIGIDAYDNPTFQLGSAVDDACAFYRWATTAGGVVPADVQLLLAPVTGVAADVPSFQPPTFVEIEDAFSKFAQTNISVPGERLYVFFAGHGLSAPGINAGNPVLVPQDVQDIARRHKLLCKLDTLIGSLKASGPEEQFFFIDACRDFVLGDKLVAPQPNDDWLPKGDAASKQLGLWATASGQQAFGTGTGVFSDALLRALAGNGPELGWDSQRKEYMLGWVALSKFVAAEVNAKITRARASGSTVVAQTPQPFARAVADATIARFPQAMFVNRELKVHIQPPAAREVCKIGMMVEIPGGTRVTTTSQSPPPMLPLPVKLSLPPNDYFVDVTGEGYQPRNEPVKLWRQTQLIDIQMEPEDVLESLVPPPKTVIRADAGRCGDMRIELRDPHDKLVASGRDTLYAEVEPGSYRIIYTPPESLAVEEEVRVQLGGTIDSVYVAPPLPVGPQTENMLAAHGMNPQGGYVEPSELLGTIPDQTLASILGLAAFAQVWPLAEMEKLRNFGVQLPPVTSEQAAISIVIATADDRPNSNMSRAVFLGATKVAIDLEDQLTPVAVAPLNDFPAGIQASGRVVPGSYTLRVELPGFPITCFAMSALPGYVSVLVVVVHATRLDVQQHILPAAPDVVARVPMDPRLLVKAERAQRWFAAGKLDQITEDHVNDLLYGKWLDPLFGALGGYALDRQGKINMLKVQRAEYNMLTRFTRLPDSHVLAGLGAPPDYRDIHFANAEALGLPVVADGVRDLVEWHRTKNPPTVPRKLAEVHRRLIPGLPWTAWTLPRPRIEVLAGSLGPIPPGWEEIADGESELVRLFQSFGVVKCDGKGASAVLIGGDIALTSAEMVDEIAKAHAPTAYFGDAYAVRVRDVFPSGLAVLELSGGPSLPPPVVLSHLRPARGLPVVYVSPWTYTIAPGEIVRTAPEWFEHDCATSGSDGWVLSLDDLSVLAFDNGRGRAATLPEIAIPEPIQQIHEIPIEEFEFKEL